MKKLEWKYWVALGLIVTGLLFIFWGSHIYMSYPGLKELMKAARQTVGLQYSIGAGCLLISWIMLKYFTKWKKK